MCQVVEFGAPALDISKRGPNIHNIVQNAKSANKKKSQKDSGDGPDSDHLPFCDGPLM